MDNEFKNELEKRKSILSKIKGITIGTHLGSGVVASAFVANHPSYGKVVAKVIYSDTDPDIENYKRAIGKNVRGIAKVYDVVEGLDPEYTVIFQEQAISPEHLPKQMRDVITHIADFCLDQNEIETCFDDDLIDNMTPKQLDLSQEMLDDAVTGMKWLRSTPELMDSNSGNYGIVDRGGRPQFAWIDFGHIIEAKQMNENIADKLGHKLVTKKIRRNSLPGLDKVYADKHDSNIANTKKVIKKVAKNLNRKPGLHNPPIMGLTEETLRKLINEMVEKELQEFSGVAGGGVVGFTGPLGMDTDVDKKSNKE